MNNETLKVIQDNELKYKVKITALSELGISMYNLHNDYNHIKELFNLLIFGSTHIGYGVSVPSKNDILKKLTADQFKALIKTIHFFYEKVGAISRNGVDIMDYSDIYAKNIDLLFSFMFTNYQMGWINWFMFDKEMGKKDLESNPVCNTLDELYYVVVVLDYPDED